MWPDRREEMMLRGKVMQVEARVHHKVWVARRGLALAVTSGETRKEVAVAVTLGMEMGTVVAILA